MKNIQLMQNFIVTAPYHSYPYSKKLFELLRTPEFLVDNYPFLNLENKSIQVSPIFDKPVLIVGAGPSLGLHGKWLQKNQNKFIIISVLSACNTLKKLNIIPDIVTHMDSSITSKKIISNLEKDFFKNTIFLFSSVIQTQTVQLLKNNHIFFFESVTNYKQSLLTLGAPSIGETSYALTLLLGTSKTYLLGLDFALDPDTKSTHSKEHIWKKEKKMLMVTKNITHL